MFWLMMGSFKFLGDERVLPHACPRRSWRSAPPGNLSPGAAAVLGRSRFLGRTGDASNIIFTVSARAATVDSALTFVTTLAMALFAKGARIGEARQPARRCPAGCRTDCQSVLRGLSAGVVVGLRLDRSPARPGGAGQGTGRFPAAGRFAGALPAGDERAARRSASPKLRGKPCRLRLTCRASRGTASGPAARFRRASCCA